MDPREGSTEEEVARRPEVLLKVTPEENKKIEADVLEAWSPEIRSMSPVLRATSEPTKAYWGATYYPTMFAMFGHGPATSVAERMSTGAAKDHIR